MADRMFNVLFLCTGNSARSIIAESHPAQTGRGPLPRLLGGKPPQRRGQSFRASRCSKASIYPTDGLRSKSWDEFAAPGAPVMDFVFTVCDTAAAETCPVWPGQPMTAHWGIEDPAAVEGTDIQKEAAFVLATQLSQESDFRSSSACRSESLDKMSLNAKLREIGAARGRDASRGRRSRDGRHHLPQSRLRNLAQHARDDPQFRGRAAHHRISQMPADAVAADATARPRRADRAPDPARKGHALSRSRPRRSRRSPTTRCSTRSARIRS